MPFFKPSDQLKICGVAKSPHEPMNFHLLTLEVDEENLTTKQIHEQHLDTKSALFVS